MLYPEHGNLPQPGEANRSEPRPRDGAPRRAPADSDGRLIGWAPGEAPLILRPGQAKLVKSGSILIFQVHYVTTGEPGNDRTSVGLIFSKDPVEKARHHGGRLARPISRFRRAIRTTR